MRVQVWVLASVLVSQTPPYHCHLTRNAFVCLASILKSDVLAVVQSWAFSCGIRRKLPQKNTFEARSVGRKVFWYPLSFQTPLLVFPESSHDQGSHSYSRWKYISWTQASSIPLSWVLIPGIPAGYVIKILWKNSNVVQIQIELLSFFGR